MAETIELRFTGDLAPDHRITARTLAHSLTHLQRAIDKTVIYERRGTVKKYSQLGAQEFVFADLIVQPFQQGSIRIPLIGEMLQGAASKIRGILEEPYQLASADFEPEIDRIANQIPQAIDRAHHAAKLPTHQNMLDNDFQLERDYFEAALLGDLNNIMSPLRSKAIGEDESIVLTLGDNERRREYFFNKEISKNFAKITKERRLGPETIYEGILQGLVESKLQPFPYTGKFLSMASRAEHKLLVFKEDDAHSLNEFNLTKQPFSFIGAALATYGAFDSHRGDIVFLKFN